MLLRHTDTAAVAITIAVVTTLVAGCTSTAENSGTEQSAARAGEIRAQITLCSRVSRRTGKRRGVGTEFVIRRGDRVHALVDLENVTPGRLLSVHLAWLRPDGDCFFKKRYDIVPDSTVAVIHGSISLSREKREPGTHRLHVYLFRRLLLAKDFTLVAKEDSPSGQSAPGGN